MTQFEIYTLILCLIVFTLLTALSIICIACIFKMQTRLIKVGAEDEKIIKEYEKRKTEKKATFGKAINYALTIIMTAFFVAVFSGSLYINCTQNAYFDNVPTYRVVKTNSMSKKNDKNEYLFKNDLNDQIQAFDLIITYKIPNEEDLKLYDIVVYETDDMLIVHRIVGIEEANEGHPNERWFLLQGDAVDASDRFPVRYEQMKGIYKGEKIPFIGSFVLFMQSPAGWLCMLLLAGAVIITPIVEKKLEKAKYQRYLLITAKDEIVVTELNDEVSPFANLKNRVRKTFDERLEESDNIVKDRYNIVLDTLYRIENLRVIEGKYQKTYKCKSVCVLRLLFRGKTLNSFLALNPSDYQDTKYIFTDQSDVKKFSNYPMRVKLSSDRQARWTTELILDIANKNGLTLLEKRVEPIKREFSFADLKKKKGKTFIQRLNDSNTAKERYNQIKEKLESIEGLRFIDSRTQETYKCKTTPIIRFTMRGKTLNAYIGLDPKEYENTKYIYQDVSSVKKFSNYPMRVKVSSDRQARWVNELIHDLARKNGLNIIEKPVVKEFSFADFKKKKSKNFKQRLNLSPIAKERYNLLKKELLSYDGARVIEGKKQVTYKRGNLSLVRFAMRGKTLNAYIALNPSEYENTKYIYQDVSSVKKFSNYPMRVKVTSDRQVKWTIELLNKIINLNRGERNV